MKRILVTGATGFVGRRLLRELLRRGDQVLALTRDRRRLRGAELLGPGDGAPGSFGERLQVVEGDPGQPGPWQEALRGCDGVVALHGEPIAGHRFTAEFKRRVESSRVDGMRRIVDGIAALPESERPRVLCGASAVGYYGPRGDERVTEADGPGGDFLSGLCVRWEQAAQGAVAHGVRVVAPRIGLVLGHGGGVLEKMAPAFKAFVGGPLGSGTQWVPWIHLDDLVALLSFVLEREEARGAVNATAPNPVTMKDFAAGLGRALHRPAVLPVPGLALRALFGEGAQPLLTGQRAVPARAQELGFRFRYLMLAEALANLFPR